MPSLTPAINWQSDRLRLLAPFITPRITEAALHRVVMGESIPSDFSKAEKKISLMLVLEINPHEVLQAQEECVLRGVSDKTLKGMKDRKEIP